MSPSYYRREGAFFRQLTLVIGSEPRSGDRPPSSPGSSYEFAYNLSSRSPSVTLAGHPGGRRQTNPPELCDHRLKDLTIKFWTNVGIDNDVAARCISLYLQTDHPLLGHFDPDLFVSHLVSKQSEYCSSLLVNALLYWACVSLPNPRAPFLFMPSAP